VAERSKIYAYTFTAYEKRKKSSPVPLDDLAGGGVDFLKIFDSRIMPGVEWPEGPEPDSDEKDTRRTVATVQSVLTPPGEPRVRYGRVQVRRPSVRHDVEMTEDEVIPIKEKNRGRRPLFYWLAAPSGSSTALLLTERHTPFGIPLKLWSETVVKPLRESFEDITFNFGYHQPVPVWEEYLKSGIGVSGLEMVRVLYEDREDKEQENATKRESVGNIVLAVERKSKIGTNKREDIAKVLKSGSKSAALEIILGEADLDLDAEEFERAYLDVQFEEGSRKVPIGSTGRFKPFGYEVDNKVKPDDDEYPRVDHMLTFCAKLASQIAAPILRGS
jgi:hypothetical protein